MPTQPISKHGRVKTYIEYFPGTLPLIFTSPHGGIPVSAAEAKKFRPGNVKSVNKGIDSCTREMCVELANRLEELTGQRPHLIRANMMKQLLNMNRKKSEALITQAGKPHPDVVKCHNDYLSFVNEAKRTVVDKFGTGHLIDWHGQVSRGKRTHLGSHVASSRCNRTEAQLDVNSAANRQAKIASSAAHLMINGGATGKPVSLGEYVKGETSLGALLAARGVRAIPSPSEFQIVPDAKGQKLLWSGGYTSFTQGSRNNKGSINSTQAENYTNFMRHQRTQYVNDWAEALLDFLEEQYQFTIPRKSVSYANNPLFKAVKHGMLPADNKNLIKVVKSSANVYYFPVMQCKKLCDKTKDCSFFSIDQKRAQCRLYSSADNLVSRNMYTFYDNTLFSGGADETSGDDDVVIELPVNADIDPNDEPVDDNPDDTEDGGDDGGDSEDDEPDEADDDEADGNEEDDNETENEDDGEDDVQEPVVPEEPTQPEIPTLPPPETTVISEAQRTEAVFHLVEALKLLQDPAVSITIQQKLGNN